jgi:hypothetical protein
MPSLVVLTMRDANGQRLSLGSRFYVRDRITATTCTGCSAGRTWRRSAPARVGSRASTAA